MEFLFTLYVFFNRQKIASFPAEIITKKPTANKKVCDRLLLIFCSIFDPCHGLYIFFCVFCTDAGCIFSYVFTKTVKMLFVNLAPSVIMAFYKVSHICLLENNGRVAPPFLFRCRIPHKHHSGFCRFLSSAAYHIQSALQCKNCLRLRRCAFPGLR